MRTRLTPQARRAEILIKASKLFHRQGYEATEMEHIRQACGISRGGLYHHFDAKDAILTAIVTQEVEALADMLKRSKGFPIVALMECGSSHLGADPGIVTALATLRERQLYLSCLDRSMEQSLAPVLATKLAMYVKPDIDAMDVAELFLTITSHINRRVCLGDWTDARGAGFAAFALSALCTYLQDTDEVTGIIRRLRERSEAP